MAKKELSPLHPQIQPLVDAINTAAEELPSIWEQSVEDRRAGYLKLSRIAGDGPELGHVADHTIADVPVRTYSNDGAHGAFVFLHGGGHVQGDLDTHDQTCRQLAVESGATVIAVDYRLAPEHPFPAAFDDSWAVVAAIAADRGRYGGPIVVGGDSAGGNLAASVAIQARNENVELAAQLLVYPQVDVEDDSPSMTENADGYVLTREGIDWFMHHNAPDPTDWRASPILADLTGVAAALVITTEFDPLRDQGIRYVAALQRAGVEVRHVLYEGMPHVFFQLGSIIDAGADAVTLVAETARNALVG